jgi:hypothetical protein
MQNFARSQKASVTACCLLNFNPKKESMTNNFQSLPQLLLGYKTNFISQKTHRFNRQNEAAHSPKHITDIPKAANSKWRQPLNAQTILQKKVLPGVIRRVTWAST